MKQRIERSKNPEVQNKIQNGQNEDSIEEKSNPIVALEPDELKQGSNFLGSKKGQSTSVGPKDTSKTTEEQVHSGPLPSLYLQEKIYLYNKD
jgi:hypothetical protein